MLERSPSPVELIFHRYVFDPQLLQRRLVVRTGADVEAVARAALARQQQGEGRMLGIAQIAPNNGCTKSGISLLIIRSTTSNLPPIK